MSRLSLSQNCLAHPQCNPITAVCVSKDKRWIATADSGEDSMIVVWDSSTATPVTYYTKTIKN
jgi:hypothetical protein